MSRRRLDRELVARGLVATIEDAHQKIQARKVVVDRTLALKPSTLVLPTSAIEILTERRRSSRAGLKLSSALEKLGIHIAGKVCLDAGVGHGGFTQELLERGAKEVVAIDVGYGQIDADLRGDPRVTLLERSNLRTVAPMALGGPFDFVTADLSFISLTAVMDKLCSVLAPEGDMVLLVKPQFEASPAKVPKGGVVTDPSVWRDSLVSVVASIENKGLGIESIVPSDLKGVKGNREFFVWSRFKAEGASQDLIEEAIRSVG